MNGFFKSFFLLALLSIFFLDTAQAQSIVIDPHASPRVQYGAQRLAQAIKSVGLNDSGPGPKIIIEDAHEFADRAPGHEGFILESKPDGTTIVAGADDSGQLYGCLELASRIEQAKKIPADLHVTDAPAFRLRGPCIGMQKTEILPGRKVYEYPYTPELFPFFYDKQFWQTYLDYLVDHRMNTLYLWSGHPFASLVKLDDYPYALEVSPEIFAKNVEMFRYITTEADRRGIWVVQMFYNIIVSKPFAEHNNIKTQLSAPTPLVADYTRKSIAEFVKQYPNVGLMLCLGEALEGIDNQVQWCTKVILPGVKDGMAQAHLTAEPPVIIRTHATDAKVVIPEALKVYKNICTEAKFNGESLTTYEPRGVRQELHLAMSKIAATHIANVHILANLEPFRYGDQRFIKQCVIAARDRLGARGIHLYPLFYWNWPDSPDLTNPPLKQLDRDWIWFEAWSRYAWNPDIDDATDHTYWINRISSMYGPAAAENILAAYNDSGECAPRLLRRFGITEGNRQTLSLGMTLDQLVNPSAYRAFSELWESQSPPGERLEEYAEKEWKHQPHSGETPPQIVEEVLSFSKQAVDEIDAAAPQVAQNKEEFDRLRNDVHCIAAMSQNYCDKVNAALLVLRYNYSHETTDLEKASGFLAKSLDDYRALIKLTEHAYRFANSMQTDQRTIPVPGGIDGHPANFLWSQLLPIYETELSDFQAQLIRIKQGGSVELALGRLPRADFKLLSKDAQTYNLQPGARIFTDEPQTISGVSSELRGLIGIRFSNKSAQQEKPTIEFQTERPVQVLIGYFRSAEKPWLQVPNLETDAGAAEHGGTEPIIQNALVAPSLPPIDVYAQHYPAGKNNLDIRGVGSFIIVGVIPQSAKLQKHDAHLMPAN